MWVKPEPVTSGPLWTVVHQDTYFQIVRQKFTTLRWSAAHPFRILLRTDPLTCIGIAASLEEAQKELIFAEKQIVSKCPGGLPREDMLSFLLTKFQSMNVDSSTIDEENKKVADSQVLETFYNTFQLKGENLVSVYVCSLWDKLPIAGTMYLSENHICWASVRKKTITISFVEVKAILKETHKKLHTIKIQTEKSQHWFIVLKRDETYNMLEQLWHMAMKRILDTSQATLQEIEAQYGAVVAPIDPDASVPGQISGNTKEELSRKAKDTAFQLQFRLPSDESLLKKVHCKVLKANVWRKADVYFGPRFLCIQSKTYGNGKSFVAIIPYQEIVDMTKTNDVNNDFNPTGEPDYYTINIFTGSIQYSIFFAEARDEMFQDILNARTKALKSDAVESGYVWSNSIVDKIYDSLKMNIQEFSPLYAEKEERQLDLWLNYFVKHGNSMSMLRTKGMKDIMRQGMPNKLRGRLWMITSGAYAYMITRPKGYYQSILDKYREKESIAKDEIDKDVHRSFPEHEYFQTEEGINSLRRVLTAYSWHNSTVGYCQSMNIVCALLLLFLPEEQAFFMMCVICEQLIPDYWAKAMIGSIVDQRIFEELMKTRMPQIVENLDETGLPLAMISLPWFLCLFIGYVPLEVSLRILDCFFHEGPDILFPIGMAIFKINEGSIVEKKDGAKIAKKMKDHIYDSDQLLEIAFTEYQSIPLNKIVEKRNAFRFTAIKEMQSKSKTSQFRELVKVQHYDFEELDRVWGRFTQVSFDFCVNFVQFEKIFLEFVPWWRFGIAELFKLLDKSHTGTIDFPEFVSTISTIHRGTFEERVKFCFSLFDGDSDSFISPDEFAYALNVLYSFLQKEKERKELGDVSELDLARVTDPSAEHIHDFVDLNDSNIFDRRVLEETFASVDADKDGRITLDEFTQAIKQPLIVLTLGLDV